MSKILFNIYPIVSAENAPYFKCTPPDTEPEALLQQLAKNNEGLYLLQAGAQPIYLGIPICAANEDIYEAYIYAQRKQKMALFFELIEELMKVGTNPLTPEVIMDQLSHLKGRCSKFFKELLVALKEKAAQFASSMIKVGATLAPKLARCPVCDAN